MAEHPSNRPPVNEMVNGHHDVSIANSSVKNTEEMLEQIKQLILENNNLKETMKVKNQVMKDRLERLYELFKSRFLEVDRTSLELRRENELLRKQNQILKETMEEPPHEASDNSASEEGTETPRQVKAQLLRLRAEKADLLGIISELQLKLNSYSSEDSFFEVRFPDQEACGDQNEMKIISGNAAHEDLAYSSKSIDEEKNCMESEEMTVRQLLHSLREEIQKVETLEKALTIANERIAQMEKPNVDSSEKDIQTDLDTSKGDGPCAEAFASELDTLKLKVKTLNKELQDTTEKLNEAEQLKRRLQDKCIILDKSLSENKVDLEERQQLVYSIKTLELQMESMKAEIKMEQDKTEDEKKQYYALWEEFNKQKYDYDDLKKRESEKVPKAQFNELCQKLDVCEKALAKKQIQIDEMNEIVTKHKEDLETIALLRAQIDVYCSDFHAEREARENIHQERERLATQLTIMMEENEKLNAEVMGRHTMEDFQRRHSFKNSGNGYESPHLVQRGADSREQPTLTTFTCPKCSVTVPDMDTLQIHVMDCIT